MMEIISRDAICVGNRSEFHKSYKIAGHFHDLVGHLEKSGTVDRSAFAPLSSLTQKSMCISVENGHALSLHNNVHDK